MYLFPIKLGYVKMKELLVFETFSFIFFFLAYGKITIDIDEEEKPHLLERRICT